jgi:hypothetical protein
MIFYWDSEWRRMLSFTSENHNTVFLAVNSQWGIDQYENGWYLVLNRIHGDAHKPTLWKDESTRIMCDLVSQKQILVYCTTHFSSIDPHLTWSGVAQSAVDDRLLDITCFVAYWFPPDGSRVARHKDAGLDCSEVDSLTANVCRQREVGENDIPPTRRSADNRFQLFHRRRMCSMRNPARYLWTGLMLLRERNVDRAHPTAVESKWNSQPLNNFSWSDWLFDRKPLLQPCPTRQRACAATRSSSDGDHNASLW